MDQTRHRAMPNGASGSFTSPIRMATNLASLGHCDSGEFRTITGRAVDAKKTTRTTQTANAATECMTAVTQPDLGSVISYSVFGFVAPER